MATPFVQGRLLDRPLRGRLDTVCDCCGAPIEVDIDSEARFTVVTRGAQPLVSLPLVNFDRLRPRNIIDAF